MKFITAVLAHGNGILYKMSLLGLLTVGSVFGANAGLLIINESIDGAPVVTRQVEMTTGKTYSITKTGYDVSSVQILGPGSCKYSASGNRVTFSSVDDVGCAVYLVWTAWVYTITYDANKGELNKASKVTARFGESLTAYGADSCTLDGYRLKAWNTSSKGSGSSVALGAKLTMGTYPISNLDTKLYAQWQAEQYPLNLVVSNGISAICYKINGAKEWASVTTSSVVHVDYDSDWQAYAKVSPGYNYTGTSELNPAKGKMTKDGAEFFPIAVARSVVVSFRGNGSTSGSVGDQTFTFDESKYLSQNQFARRYKVSFDTQGGSSCESLYADYAFKSWNDQADGLGVYSYSDQQMVTNPCGSTGTAVALYAQWKPLSVTLPSVASRDGAAFVGWYADQEGQFKVGDSGDEFTPTRNVTLYAKWAAECRTVVFVDGYTSSGAVDGAVIRTNIVLYGSSVEPPAPPAHPGYSFTGWNSADYKKVTLDCTISAQYAPIAYQVTYHSNYRNGQLEASALSAECGPGKTYYDYLNVTDAATTKFAKTGYVFSGWSWAADSREPDWRAGESMFYTVIANHLDADGKANLYAVWEPVEYVVRFEGNGGSGEMAEMTNRYDRPAFLTPNAFVRDGFTFDHWKWNQKDFADSAVISNLTEKTETLTFTAQWTSAREHYVRFDPSGATNGTMCVQRFQGTESQPLCSNQFVKTGYVFVGWTNSVGTAYTDRARYAFGENDPHGSTNMLMAVWEPVRYTIIFNTGTNDVLGTMAPLTDCVYDTKVIIPCGFTNCVSTALLGWTDVPDSTEVKFKAKARDDTVAPSSTTVSNLTVEADGKVVLYAVWADLGELSEFVELTNSALYSTPYSTVATGDEADWQPNKRKKEIGWDEGHDYRAALATKFGDMTVQSESGCTLNMSVNGPGELAFKWCFRLYDGYTAQDLTVYDNGTLVTNLVPNLEVKTGWDDPVKINIVTPGLHQLSWRFSGDLSPEDIIAIDDVVWTPDPSFVPDYEVYRLTYVNTNDAVVMAALPATYMVTNDTFAIPVDPKPMKEGFVFAGWSPAKIAKGTTGDIEVKAKWTPVATTHTVTFDIGDGTRAGGGELVQQVERGFDAVAPEVSAAEGFRFTGWSRAFTNVLEDLEVKASYEAIRYRVDYRETKGFANPNPLEFTSADGIVFEEIENSSEWRFCGWTPSEIVKGTTSNVVVQASWSARTWYQVTFALGDYLVRTGGGALVQSVEAFEDAEEPQVRADEGWTFVKWGVPETNGQVVTVSPELRPQSCEVTLDGASAVRSYGEVVTVTAPFDEFTEGGTNIVCTGWIGTGCVPASGTETQVVFTVTGAGSLTWLYETNYWVEVSVVGEGSVTVLDSAGGIRPEVSHWAVAGSELTAIANPVRKHPFAVWRETGSTNPTAVFTLDGPVTLTAEFSDPTCDVRFVLGDHLSWADGGRTNRIVTVKEGTAAFPPSVEPDTGYRFKGWSAETLCVLTNMTVTGTATAEVFTVVFDLGGKVTRTGGGALVQSVCYGSAAVAPTVSAVRGYSFVGWDRDFSKITSDMTVNALTTTQPLTEAYVVLTCDSARGKVTGAGEYKVNKKVTVKATANRGYIFSGWYDAQGGLASQSASYSFNMPGADVALEARFISTAEDAKSVNASLNGMPLILDGEAAEAETNALVGIAVKWPITVSASSAVTVSVSGLPSGLKFTAKPVTAKVTTGSGSSKITTIVTNVPAMTIYGTPTAGGRTSKVKITITTASKTKVTAMMSVNVSALPAELVGAYNGGSTNDPIGSASVTLAKSGKISGKWISEGKTWTISAASLSSYSPETGEIVAEVTLKNGKLIETMPLAFGIDGNGQGVATCALFDAVFVNWKTQPWKTYAAELKGTVVVYQEEGATLSAKIGANGTVTVAGSFDVGASSPYTASTKGVIMVGEDGQFKVFVYYPPKTAKNFAGYSVVFPIMK